MIIDKLVSVIIPTYKRPDYLQRTIESVLGQKYNNIEIIVVDDNNPDTMYRKNTELVMEKYKNIANVSYIQHEINKNGSAARNTGFRNSKGQFIMYLDDDDEFINNKISAQVERMNQLDESWAACYTSYIRKKNGKIVMYGAEKREGKLLKEELMRNLFVHAGSNLMVRRAVVEELNGFDESFQRNQDIEFLSRILIKYKLAYVDVIGLVVNIYEKELRLKNFEEITSDYINKFSDLIKKLPKQDQIKIDRMIGLQLFRHYFFSKKVKMAINIISQKNIPILDVARYAVHLLNRAITKKAYGFNL